MNEPLLLFRINNLDMEETWSIANVTENKRLQNLCVQRIASEFQHFVMNADHFKCTSFNGIELLVKSDLVRNVDIRSKIDAIVKWTTSGRSAEEREARVVKFEELLNNIDFGDIATSLVVDITVGNIFPGLSKDLRLDIF